MVGRRTVAAFALVAGFSGCSPTNTEPTGGGTPEPSDTAGSPSVTVPTQSPDAGKALERAVGAMVAKPEVGFTFEMFLSGDRAIRVDGFANARGWKATGEFTEPGSESSDVMHARGLGDESWMQMRDWPPRGAGCWLEVSGQAPLGVQALVQPQPIYVSLLAHLQAESFAGSSLDTLSGGLDLQAALGLLQVPLFENIELTRSQITGARVPVEIALTGGRIADLTMSGADVLTTIEASGGRVTSASRTALEVSDYVLAYPAQFEVSEVAPPPTDLVMADDSKGCH